MTTHIFGPSMVLIIASVSVSSLFAQPGKYDLAKLLQDKNLEAVDRAASPLSEKNTTGVRLDVNHANAPSLTVKELNDRKSGKIGLWVGSGSGGDFTNLVITPE